MLCSANPLEKRGDRPRGAELQHEVDRPDVDAQLERRSGDDRFQFTGPQSGLDAQPPIHREAAVMGRHLVLTDKLPEQMADPLGHTPSVDEDQRGSVCDDLCRHHGDDLIELLGRHDRAELARG